MVSGYTRATRGVFILVAAGFLTACSATSPSETFANGANRGDTQDSESPRGGLDLIALAQDIFGFGDPNAGSGGNTNGTGQSTNNGSLAGNAVSNAAAATAIGRSAVGSGASGGLGGPTASYSGNLSQYGPGPNRHLWRAALETVAFMPMALADPVTGLIQTNWHQAPGNAAERLRAEIYILSDQLRDDAVRVNVYRQAVNQATGQWTNAPVNQTTADRLENRILQRGYQRQQSGL